MNFPRFIPDKPVGVDCFKGHSQERLAHSICDYVRRADAADKSEASMSRIIGLEGSWGSGKSNVVGMIEKELGRQGYSLSPTTHGVIKKICSAGRYLKH